MAGALAGPGACGAAGVGAATLVYFDYTLDVRTTGGSNVEPLLYARPQSVDSALHPAGEGVVRQLERRFEAVQRHLQARLQANVYGCIGDATNVPWGKVPCPARDPLTPASWTVEA
jgi:hypothetical protein